MQVYIINYSRQAVSYVPMIDHWKFVPLDHLPISSTLPSSPISGNYLSFAYIYVFADVRSFQEEQLYVDWGDGSINCVQREEKGLEWQLWERKEVLIRYKWESLWPHSVLGTLWHSLIRLSGPETDRGSGWWRCQVWRRQAWWRHRAEVARASGQGGCRGQRIWNAHLLSACCVPCCVLASHSVSGVGGGG